MQRWPRPLSGFNRAQAAVIEAAILASRLRMLPRKKVERKIAYLQIAVNKTASAAEEEAWRWLMERIQAFYTGTAEGAETNGEPRNKLRGA